MAKPGKIEAEISPVYVVNMPGGMIEVPESVFKALKDGNDDRFPEVVEEEKLTRGNIFKFQR